MSRPSDLIRRQKITSSVQVILDLSQLLAHSYLVHLVLLNFYTYISNFFSIPDFHILPIFISDFDKYVYQILYWKWESSQVTFWAFFFLQSGYNMGSQSENNFFNRSRFKFFSPKIFASLAMSWITEFLLLSFIHRSANHDLYERIENWMRSWYWTFERNHIRSPTRWVLFRFRVHHPGLISPL